MTKSNEKLSNTRTMNDVNLVLFKRGDWFVIGSMFQDSCKTRDVNMAYDFFNNYAPLFDFDQVDVVWKHYVKACKQRTKTTRAAFWGYF